MSFTFRASQHAGGKEPSIWGAGQCKFLRFLHFKTFCKKRHKAHYYINTFDIFRNANSGILLLCWWWWWSQVIEAERWYKVLQKYRKCPWMLDRSQDVTRAGRGGVGEICQSHPCVDLAKIWQRQMTAKKCKNDRANMPWWKTSAFISQPGGGRGVVGGGGRGGDARGNEADFMLILVIASQTPSNSSFNFLIKISI